MAAPGRSSGPGSGPCRLREGRRRRGSLAGWRRGGPGRLPGRRPGGTVRRSGGWRRRRAAADPRSRRGAVPRRRPRRRREAVSSFSIRQCWPLAVQAGLSSTGRLARPAEIVATGMICRHLRSAEKLIRRPRHSTIAVAGRRQGLTATAGPGMAATSWPGIALPSWSRHAGSGCSWEMAATRSQRVREPGLGGDLLLPAGDGAVPDGGQRGCARTRGDAAGSPRRWLRPVPAATGCRWPAP